MKHNDELGKVIDFLQYLIRLTEKFGKEDEKAGNVVAGHLSRGRIEAYKTSIAYLTTLYETGKADLPPRAGE